jgi:hypothetical protein
MASKLAAMSLSLILRKEGCVNLKDLSRPEASGAPFLGRLSDSAGNTHYELAISGSSSLIEKIFAELEFEY